jgi:hypothetical protein
VTPPLRVIGREFPSGPASNLVGLITGGQLRERKKTLAVLGCLKGIRTAVIARCLQMSRRMVGRYFCRFASGGLNAVLPTKSPDASPRCPGRAVQDHSQRKHPLRKPHERKVVVSYMCSPDSSGITGNSRNNHLSKPSGRGNSLEV